MPRQSFGRCANKKVTHTDAHSLTSWSSATSRGPSCGCPWNWPCWRACTCCGAACCSCSSERVCGTGRPLAGRWARLPAKDLRRGAGPGVGAALLRAGQQGPLGNASPAAAAPSGRAIPAPSRRLPPAALAEGQGGLGARVHPLRVALGRAHHLAHVVAGVLKGRARLQGRIRRGRRRGARQLLRARAHGVRAAGAWQCGRPVRICTAKAHGGGSSTGRCRQPQQSRLPQQPQPPT
jgi:hypothetical protein